MQELSYNNISGLSPAFHIHQKQLKRTQRTPLPIKTTPTPTKKPQLRSPKLITYVSIGGHTQADKAD